MLFSLILVAPLAVSADTLTPVGEGYCRTSVNGAVFRGSSLVSNDSVQYISYYDPEGYVVVGKRRLGSDRWETRRTQYKGNVKDAHNVISIGLDGEGVLHMSFDHHGHTLRYCRAVAPGSLEFGALEPMVSREEQDVTYPEFYTMPDGGLIFAYRSGASGRGNLILNRYNLADRSWSRIHDMIIDGQNQRNAYWQMFVGRFWRDTPLLGVERDMARRDKSRPLLCPFCRRRPYMDTL